VRRYTTNQTTLNDHSDNKVFRVTHPFHPLFGQELTALCRRRIDGDDFLFFQNAESHNNGISVHWTNLNPPNPYIVISDGRSLFRPQELLELVQLLKDLKPAKKRSPRKKRKSGRDSNYAASATTIMPQCDL
jgi:hypothetical protein